MSIDQLVEVGALLDAGALDRVADATDRAERRIEQDAGRSVRSLFGVDARASPG
jgi:hypothetical protein